MQPLDVLMVDDDLNICQLVRLYLEKEGYVVECCQSSIQAIEAFHAFQPKLVLLDIMLPDMDGWEVCREIRKSSNTPIIMLSAKGETFDKVLGLELGADDYMTKPFDPKELVARIKAVTRRTAVREELPRELRFDHLHINMTDYTVTFYDTAMELPPKEMELLYFMASHSNIVFTREQLLEQIWGFDYFGDSRTVDVHIKRIREKLTREGDMDLSWKIKTVWGVGYKFEVKQ